MVGRFRSSGLSRAAFCQREGVALSTLDWWLRRMRREAESPSEVRFPELPATMLGARAPGSWAMEIVSPRGWTIRSQAALTTVELAAILGVRKC
jgi:hypothetical protein